MPGEQFVPHVDPSIPSLRRERFQSSDWWTREPSQTAAAQALLTHARDQRGRPRPQIGTSSFLGAPGTCAYPVCRALGAGGPASSANRQIRSFAGVALSGRKDAPAHPECEHFEFGICGHGWGHVARLGEACCVADDVLRDVMGARRSWLRCGCRVPPARRPRSTGGTVSLWMERARFGRWREDLCSGERQGSS